MSMVAWIGFLLMVSMFGFFYVIFDNGTQILLVDQNSTLNNTENVQAVGYARSMWFALPLIMLFIYGFWALNNAQKKFQ